jgi:cold shock CspA family protein
MKIRSIAKQKMFSEIRFNTQFSVIDQYGTIADHFQSDFNEVGVSKNGNELIFKSVNEERMLTISQNHVWFADNICPNTGNFIETWQNTIYKLGSLFQPKEIIWIGLRGYFLYNVDNKPFDKLIEGWRGKFFPQNIFFENELGIVSDVGITTTFNRNDLKATMSYGFMERKQSKDIFAHLKDINVLPEIGFFVDFDLKNDKPQNSINGLIETHGKSFSEIINQMEKYCQ